MEKQRIKPPPRDLNVQIFAESRASELQSLYSIVSNRVKNDFKSQQNKRRRTTGHDNRLTKQGKRKRRKLGPNEATGTSNVEKDQKKLPRRVVRRIELRKNPQSGFCTSGDGTKRLRTHLWHAKRFTMTKQWGFHLPLGLQGGGRGSRALLKWFKQGALVHDASYISAIQLEGPEASLLSVLRMVFVPSPPVHLEGQSTDILSGVCYGEAMLHHVEAPCSQLISPVTYMWRPRSKGSIENDSESNHTMIGTITTEDSTDCNSFRQLWIWIHGSSMLEGYDALQHACKKQTEETGIIIKCFSLEGQLAKLEVLGSKAVQILQKIIHPITRTPQDAFQLKNCSAVEAIADSAGQTSFSKYSSDLPSKAVLSLTVDDPRELPKVESVSAPPVSLTPDVYLYQKDSNEHTVLDLCENETTRTVSSLNLKFQSNKSPFSDSEDLWKNPNLVKPPVDENFRCMERHQKRMHLFHLGEKKLSTSVEVKNQCSRSCRILLLKDGTQSGSFAGYTIILPLSWVKAFWIPLIACGARAIGLRERRWIACNVGLPCFPNDFPDCKAYSETMAFEASASDQKILLRPPAMRPLRIPIPPPWDCVKHSIDRFITCTEDEIASIGKIYPRNSRRQGDFSFSWFVARTTKILNRYLNDVPGDHLFLSPNRTTVENAKGIQDVCKSCPFEIENSNKPIQHEICFLRVLLHHYKEGVFEEGAILCAPRLTDILLWTSRSEEQVGLQISESSMRSYFMQQPSGNWQLETPANPVSSEPHRLLIGFVTTGFVRGSTKPVAVGLCEATLLARLRNEQWSGIKLEDRKNEIFVLVRNIRSVAYRLAVATIVLEQQEEDVSFL